MKDSLAKLPDWKRGELARRFYNFAFSYVKARYNPKYTITAEELKYPARCVEYSRPNRNEL